MVIETRRSVCEELSKFSSIFGENDIIEIIEWSNGEGWNISITTNNNDRIISIHRDELNALNYLTKVLEYEKS